MAWRPIDWKNPHKLHLDKPCLNKELPEIWNIEPAYSGFEAGANAILTYFLGCGIITISQLEALDKNGDDKGKPK